MLRAAFVRTPGQPDRIYVVRSDGSEVSWSYPTYGDGLPHDLVHLVVESAFGLRDGFWGRVDGGANPRVINDQANRMGGADKYAAFGSDRSELDVAEALATTAWAEATVEAVRAGCATLAVNPPADLDEERIGAVRDVFAALATRWRGLLPKGALNLVFHRETPRTGFDEMRRELL